MTPEEFFNTEHAIALNLIKRFLGLLKIRWGIFRSLSFYPIRIDNHIIIGFFFFCFIILLRKMTFNPIKDEGGEYLHDNRVLENESAISAINPTNV